MNQRRQRRIRIYARSSRVFIWLTSGVVASDRRTEAHRYEDFHPDKVGTIIKQLQKAYEEAKRQRAEPDFEPAVDDDDS